MGEIIRVCRSSAICRDVFCSGWVTRKNQMYVLMQSVKINNCSCTKRRKEEDSSLYRGHKFFLSEDWFEVVRVDYSVASIPPFRVDISPSSKSIWFGAKTTRIESDDKIELREVLGPLYLPLG